MYMYMFSYVIADTCTYHCREAEEFGILYMEYHGPVNFLGSEFREILRNLQLIPTEVRKYECENSGGIPYQRNSVDTLLPGSKWGF